MTAGSAPAAAPPASAAARRNDAPPDLPLPTDWSRQRIAALSAVAWVVIDLCGVRHWYVWGDPVAWLFHAAEGAGLVAFTLLAGTAFARCVRQASSLPLAFLWRAGLLLVLIAWLTPPFLSADVFDYLARGRVEVLGYDPYVTPVQALADHPRMQAHAELSRWDGHVMPYGPLSAVLQRLFAAIDDPWFGAYAWKALGAAAHVLSAWLLAAAARALHGEREARRVLVLWLWNPFLLLESCCSGHNDGVQALFLAAMAAWLAKGALAGAGGSFALSLLVKHGSAPLAPLLLGLAIARRQVGRLATGVAVVAGLGALAWWSRFAAPGALDFVLKQAELRTTSFGALLQSAGLPAAASALSFAGLLASFAIAFVGLRRAVDPAAFARWGILAMAVLLLFGSPAFAPWYHLWWLPLFALANAPVASRVVELLAWTGPLSYLVYATARRYDAPHQVWQFALAGLWPCLLLLLEWRSLTGMPKRIAGADLDDD